MSQNFYNKVAKKFGGYTTPADKPVRECAGGDPEKIFKEKLIELSSKDKVALDIGCADGRFTLSVAPYFKTIYAIDLSKEMLKVANKSKEEQSVKNVIFDFQNASKTEFESGFFDVVYNRRGPSFFKEFARVLKNNGYYLEICIGRKDAMDLKKIFGRGQGFGEWNISRLDIDKKDLIDNGFEIQYAKEFLYDEYFKSENDFDLFLQGVPIFEDYDSRKDSHKLQKYIKSYSCDKGIKLPRHRIVILVKKSGLFQ